MARVWSPEHTWWKERNDFRKLSSDLRTNAAALEYTHYTHREICVVKTRDFKT